MDHVSGLKRTTCWPEAISRLDTCPVSGLDLDQRVEQICCLIGIVCYMTNINKWASNITIVLFSRFYTR